MAGRVIILEGHHYRVSHEVRDATINLRGVVALESTIITHGMPFPQNLEMAKAVEKIVRDEGAVPATVGVMDRQILIGMDDEQLRRLASDSTVFKASSRDLAAIVVKMATAGTTVAATMLAAAWAKVPIFATGGIGGVHRGAEQTFDISADLYQLGRTPVAVVCAGCKSILDIAKTLEVLESQGVPVFGYRTDEFPAFFARSSGHKIDHRFETPDEIGEAIEVHRQLESGTGVLVVNPVPESDALPSKAMENYIEVASREAEVAAIAGKDLTPFLLKRINELSQGASLRANLALIKNNARLAAQIAKANADFHAAVLDDID